MKTNFIAILAVAVITPVTVLADSCNRGGVYCGTSLLNKGNYHDHIVQTLEAAGKPTDDRHIQSSLFDCLSGGEIRYRDFCGNGCGGVGSEDPDYCL